ncbi:MAG TPA: amidohydrolase family protein [Candidatus Acidoferrum sp.]|jgi:L-fuconolactonase|nr:amidohydrolase family protein [Candidatus Acidoferrum sp.]
MHIDAHQHFWIYDPREYEWIDETMTPLRRDFLPADLRHELEREGFQGSVAVQARQSLRETRSLLDFATQSPFILGVVGWVDLRSPQAGADLKPLAQNPKLVGIRHIVQSEPDDRFLLQSDFLRGISLLREFDLAYDILIYPKHLTVAAEFVRRFPEQRFVLDHMAKPEIRSGKINQWKKGIAELAAYPNVYCKLSGLVTEADCNRWKPEDMTPYLDVAFEYFEANRLMIGSDWPVCTLAGSYSQVMGLVKEYLSGHSEQEREAVLGGNAKRFWRLKAYAR